MVRQQLFGRPAPCASFILNKLLFSTFPFLAFPNVRETFPTVFYPQVIWRFGLQGCGHRTPTSVLRYSVCPETI